MVIRCGKTGCGGKATGRAGCQPGPPQRWRLPRRRPAFPPGETVRNSVPWREVCAIGKRFSNMMANWLLTAFPRGLAVAGEVTPGADGAADLRVQRLDRVGGVDEPADFGWIVEERDHLVPGPSPAGRYGRVARGQIGFLELGQNGLCCLDIDGGVDGLSSGPCPPLRKNLKRKMTDFETLVLERDVACSPGRLLEPEAGPHFCCVFHWSILPCC